MTIQHGAQSKEELLEQMAQARIPLDAAIARIPRERFLEAGQWGGWTLKDLVAHVAAYERWTAEQLISPPTLEQQSAIEGQASEGTDALNEMIYRDHKEDALDDVLAESRAAYELLRQTIEGLDDEAFREPLQWAGGQAAAELVSENSHEHYHDHIADLRAVAAA